MGRTISATSILNNTYPTVGVDEKTKRIIGDVEVGFTVLIWGESGNGKTTFAIRELAAYFALNHGKVYYNSKEQGEGKAIQDVLGRCDLTGLKSGRFMFGDRDSYAEMKDKIQRISPRYIFIDSADYINLTKEQYKELRDICHKGRKKDRKSLIIISWASGEEPKSQYMKDVRYMVDVKIHVHHKTAKVNSRFGATDDWHIFQEQFITPKDKPKPAQGNLFKLA